MSDDAERERARYEALAALVDNYRRERDDAREQLYLTKRELGRWVDREAKAVRERDEARAEVGRRPPYTPSEIEWLNRAALADRQYMTEYDARKIAERERDEARASVADAYRRGAEAMREACAQWVDHWVSGHVADKLRDMPIPEEP